jgi:hypothetical protein
MSATTNLRTGRGQALSDRAADADRTSGDNCELPVDPHESHAATAHRQ